MARATYTEIECKSALNRVTNMGFNWSLNPYKGCVHACAYCYARANHSYLGLDAGTDFETKLFVKTNIVEVLRRQLANRTWKRDEVAIGTSTDPYQPIEGKYRLTGGIISALADYATPAHIVTKSPLVIRDIDEPARLDERGPARVCFTITTLDDDGPAGNGAGNRASRQRLRAMKMLADAGIPTGIFLAPVMPRITDSEDHLRAIFEAAASAGARFVWSSARSGSCLPCAITIFPGRRSNSTVSNSLTRYARNYRTPDAPREHREFVRERIHQLRDEYGLPGGGRASDTSPGADAVAVADRLISADER
ncbi:MAG: radical SAM protein [Thermomicrobiales bacterium]